jgi:hypothetical protein
VRGPSRAHRARRRPSVPTRLSSRARSAPAAPGSQPFPRRLAPRARQARAEPLKWYLGPQRRQHETAPAFAAWPASHEPPRHVTAAPGGCARVPGQPGPSRLPPAVSPYDSRRGPEGGSPTLLPALVRASRAPGPAVPGRAGLAPDHSLITALGPRISSPRRRMLGNSDVPSPTVRPFSHDIYQHLRDFQESKPFHFRAQLPSSWKRSSMCRPAL